MPALPNGLRIFAVERTIAGESRVLNIAARNPREAGMTADSIAADLRRAS